MKLEIFDEKKKPDVLRLMLVYSASKEVQLIAVDGDGNKIPDGIILSISNSGCLYKHRGINPSIPVQRAAHQTIKEMFS